LGEVLRGSLASGGVHILDENVAELAVTVSSAGKKKKLLFFLAEMVRWAGVSHGLGRQHGLLLGYGGPTCKYSLLSFSLFIFCLYFSVFEFYLNSDLNCSLFCRFLE
jgi:hypothetical protein